MISGYFGVFAIIATSYFSYRAGFYKAIYMVSLETVVFKNPHDQHKILEKVAALKPPSFMDRFK